MLISVNFFIKIYKKKVKTVMVNNSTNINKKNNHLTLNHWGGHCGPDCMAVEFITKCAISAYPHLSYEFEFRSWRGVLDTLCDKVCQWLVTGWWFSPGTLVSSTIRTDHHNITEIVLKVALNTINLTPLNHWT